MLNQKILTLNLIALISIASVVQAAPAAKNLEQQILCEAQDTNSRLYAIELGANSSKGRNSIVYRHSMLGNAATVTFTCNLSGDVLSCGSTSARTSVSIFLQKPLVQGGSHFMYKQNLTGFRAKIADNYVGGGIDAICELQGFGSPGEIPHGRVLKN